MKWFDPKALAIRFFVIYLLLVSAQVLVLIIVLWVLRYWYLLAIAAALVFGTRWLLRWNRDRLGRW